MRVRVDWDRCQGHARCIAMAPAVFHMDDAEDHSFVAVDVIPDEQHEAVRQAALSCPEDAIVIEEAAEPSG